VIGSMLAVMALAVMVPSASAAAASSSSSSSSSSRCLARGGRFLPYARDDKPAFAADLTYCTNYQSETCCGRANSDQARLDMRNLALNGAPENCPETWAMHFACSGCDPAVSAKPAPTVMCRRACDAVYDACGSAYVGIDPQADVLAPCSLERRDLLCSRLSEFVSDGAELCREAGFAVAEAGNCFEGQPEGVKRSKSAKSSSSSSKKSPSKKSKGDQKRRQKQWFEAYLADLKRRYRHLRKRYGVVADLILVAPFLSLTLTLGKTFSRRLARARRIAHVREAAAVAAEQRRRL